jgi:hypothetical protein
VADVVALGASTPTAPSGDGFGRMLLVAVAALLALAAAVVAGASAEHAGVGMAAAHRRLVGFSAAGLMAAAALALALTAL